MPENKKDSDQNILKQNWAELLLSLLILTYVIICGIVLWPLIQQIHLSTTMLVSSTFFVFLMAIIVIRFYSFFYKPNTSEAGRNITAGNLFWGIYLGVVSLIISTLILYLYLPNWCDKNAPWTVITSVAAAPSLIILWYLRDKYKQRELECNDARLVADRFAKAVEMLGSRESSALCLGGIHTLIKLTNDAKNYYATILNVLWAFVQTNRANTSIEKGKELAKANAQIKECENAIADLQKFIGELTRLDNTNNALFGNMFNHLRQETYTRIQSQPDGQERDNAPLKNYIIKIRQEISKWKTAANREIKERYKKMHEGYPMVDINWNEGEFLTRFLSEHNNFAKTVTEASDRYENWIKTHLVGPFSAPAKKELFDSFSPAQPSSQLTNISPALYVLVKEANDLRNICAIKIDQLKPYERYSFEEPPSKIEIQTIINFFMDGKVDLTPEIVSDKLGKYYLDDIENIGKFVDKHGLVAKKPDID